jgi:hypothetical protein
VDVSAVATVHGAKDPDGNTAADTSSATFIVDTLTTAAAISSGGGGGAVYYALNLTKSGSGSGTITGAGLTCGSSCTTSLVYGQTASLTAIADSDSIFAGWNGACSPSGTSTVCSLTMTADQTATAMFNLLSTPASNPPVSIPSPITPSIPVRLINDSGTFYLVINSVLHGITNPGILNSYGLTFSDAQPATAETQALPTGANLLPNNGSLVKAPKSSTVYLISQGEKYGFASSKVFTSLGFKFKSVLVVTAPELNLLPLGGIISNPKSQHLPGVDINKNGTVYWIGADNQLHGYPSLATYNSWHMADDFSVVVPANAADMVLPVGSLVSARVLQ